MTLTLPDDLSPAALRDLESRDVTVPLLGLLPSLLGWRHEDAQVLAAQEPELARRVEEQLQLNAARARRRKAAQ